MTIQTTLRTLAGIPPLTALDPAKTALLLIDFQREYFDGALPLPDAPAAAAQAARLVAAADRCGVPVFHVHHVAGHPAAQLFARDAAGATPVAGLVPLPGHRRIEKGLPSAFAGTSLEAELRAAGRELLLIAGLMTHMCVDSTARDAVHRGFRVALAADACATHNLPNPLGGVIAHATLHAASLAALADRFADVLATDRLAALLTPPDG
jgi:nicotinamidase-related amidase